MKRFIKNLVPASLKSTIRRRIPRGITHSTHLQGSTNFADIGEAGPLIKDIFEKIKDVPGWFNVDDCGHFYLMLSYQSAIGVRGDVFEIGSYHGRSTSAMAHCLQPDERIVVCDAFESDTDDKYTDKPSPEKLVSNIRRVCPGLEPDQLVIHKCLSSDLSLDPAELFRFIHIDGGHSAEQTYFDLNLCYKHVSPGGVIVIDDYDHKHWPGVTQGTDRFLNENRDIAKIADLNRHGAIGRKLYLAKVGQLVAAPHSKQAHSAT